MNRQKYLKPRSVVVDHSGYSKKDQSGFTIKHTVDAQPIIDAVKARSETIDRHADTVAGARYLGSIDPITAANFAKECGAAIGTKEFAKYAKKRLNDNYKKFRADIT